MIKHLCYRGQESAGIVTGFGLDPYDLFQHKGMGMVNHVFREADGPFNGNLALGKISI